MELQELNERLMNNSMDMVYKMEELNDIIVNSKSEFLLSILKKLT